MRVWETPLVAATPSTDDRVMPEDSTSAGSGFAVREQALAAFASTAGRIAAELDGFAHRELGTATDLPTNALSPLAHTSGFTAALVRFCGRVTDTAHGIGAAVHEIESAVESVRAHYHDTDRTVADRLTGRKVTV